MLLKIRLRLVIGTIIAINWVLSKLTSYICSKNLVDLMESSQGDVDLVFVFKEPECSLDICLDQDENNRAYLRTWQTR